jgi:hypothetical protein
VGKVNLREVSKVKPMSRMEQWHSNMYVIILCLNIVYRGARGSIVVKALCYKSEGRKFDTR